MSIMITAEIKKLSLPERILMVEEIWDTIVNNAEYPALTATQRSELIKRMDSYHANPQQGRTWDEIKRVLYR